MTDNPSSASVVPVTVIRPSRGWISLNLRDLWEYRELLYFLTWRDVKVRYKQTVLGAAWAIIQPFFTMVVFSLFFGKLAKMPSDDIPYPIFSYAALVPWTFFANGLSQSSSSLVASANLIKKVYFPRLVVPISSVISGAVDFVLAFAVLLGMMLYFGIVPTWNMVWLPLLLLLALVTSLGVGLWLTAMKCDFACSSAMCATRCLSWCRPGCLPHPSPIPAVCSMSRGVLCMVSIPWQRGLGLPLGTAGDRDGTRPYCPRLGVGSGGAAGQRCVLLPTDGEDVRRCSVTTDDKNSRRKAK